MNTIAYRGYLIMFNPIWKTYYVTSGGINIATYQTLEEAKAGIDELLD